MIQRRTKLALWAEKYPTATKLFGLGAKKCPQAKKMDYKHRYKGTSQMDFARGVAEMTDAIETDRVCRLSAEFSLHVNEIVLAIERPTTNGCPHEMQTRFDPMEPMPWAQ